MNRALAAISVALFAPIALATEPYEGKWAAEASWCGNTPATTDQVPVTITSAGMSGYETDCRFIGVEQEGNAWIATERCSSEGMTWTERTRMMVSGDRLTLTSEDGIRTTLVRCK
jgi:hypothetical protein